VTWSGHCHARWGRLGHQVSVYLPRYRQTKLTSRPEVRSVTIPFMTRSIRLGCEWRQVCMGYALFRRISAAEFRPGMGAFSGVPRQEIIRKRRALRLVFPHRPRASRFSASRRFFTVTTGNLPDPRSRCKRLRRGSAFRDVGTVSTIHTWAIRDCFPPDTLPLLMLPGIFTMSKVGILRPSELPEGRVDLFRSYHGQPEVQQESNAEITAIGLERRSSGDAPRRDRNSPRESITTNGSANRKFIAANIHRRIFLARRCASMIF